MERVSGRLAWREDMVVVTSHRYLGVNGTKNEPNESMATHTEGEKECVMSKTPSGIRGDEVGGPRLIEASVEIVQSFTVERSLVCVVPPDITDDQVKKIVYRLLVEEGEGIEMTRTAAEGFILGESGPTGIVEMELVERGDAWYDVELRAGPSGSIFVKMKHWWDEEAYEL
jgi:hypothetical protein